MSGRARRGCCRRPRAALIEAGRPVRVSVPQPATTASVLFDAAFAPAPPAPLMLSAFNAAFQELTGRTPTEYRASFRP